MCIRDSSSFQYSFPGAVEEPSRSLWETFRESTKGEVVHAHDKRFIGGRWRDDSGGVDYVVIAGVKSRNGGSGPSFIKQGSRE